MMIILACVVGAQLSCAPSIDVPPPPDISGVLAGFEEPTADVTREIMSEFGDEIDDLEQLFNDTGIFDQIVEVVIDVQEELDAATDENGNLVIEGVSLPAPNGVIEINHICRGWDGDLEEPDEALNGRLDLTIPLGGGRLGPIIWGEAQGCRYLATAQDQPFEVIFDGSIALALVDPLRTQEDLKRRPLTFVLSGSFTLDGQQSQVDQSFRTNGEGRLEVLIAIDGDLTFVYFFEADSQTQGIRDVTGIFGCSLQERQCVKTAGAFSWD